MACITPVQKRNPFSRLRDCEIDSKRRRIFSPPASPAPSSSSTSSSASESILADPSYMGKNFTTLRALGEGDFGVVKEVLCKHTFERFAVKISKVDKMKVKSGLNYVKTHLDEVRAHSCLPSHPNLLQFHQAWKEDGYIHMLLELCEDSLDGYWRKMVDLDQKDLRAVLRDALSALSHLSSLNVAHLDVKPGNILRTEDGVYKLADFSVAVDLGKGSSTGEFGDGRFAAPELLDGVFSPKADLFSLAMSVIQVSVPASAPLSKDEWSAAKNEGKMPGRVNEALSSPLNSTISSMLREHATRPSVEDLLRKVSPIEEEFEVAKSENKVLRDLVRRLSLSPSFERELRENKSPLIRDSENSAAIFHTHPQFYEIQKPLRQRASMGSKRPPRRPIFD